MHHWTQAEDDLLRSLVDKDDDGENDEVPALSWRQVAIRMNDYVKENGPFTNSSRVYTSGMIRLRWRHLQEINAKIDPYAEEVAEELRSKEDKSNVDADFEEITEEQFRHSPKR